MQHKTAACGTSRPRKGLPVQIKSAKFKKKGESIAMTSNNKLVAFRILDRKHVILISTVYNCHLSDNGQKHCQTKEKIESPDIIRIYSIYMGGVDSNDQLLQYSAFPSQSLKWWKKVFFQLINLAMVNAFILYRDWKKASNDNAIRKRISQTDFRM